MKKMKKVLAFVMAMAMVLGMSLTSFASEGSTIPNPNPTTDKAPASGTSADKGTIAISGVAANDDESESTISVTAYQIIKARYENNKPAGGGDDSGKFSGYEDVYPTAGVDFVDEKGELIESSITEANLAAIRAYIENQNVVGTEMNATNTSGEYMAENVPVGTYLVVISGAEGMIYSNIVVSVQYVNEDGSSEQVESANLYIHDGMTFAKVQENPTIEKKIVETVEGGENKVNGNSENVGKTVKYEIKADIPTYSGEHPVYKVIDTLDGLLYKAGTLKVDVIDKDGKSVLAEGESVIYNIEDAAGTVITDASITNKIILNFVSTVEGKNVYHLNKYAGKTLVITYEATVDADTAHFNQDPNTNTVVLEYTHNSNVDGEDDTTDDSTRTYTFDLSGELNGNKETSVLTKTGESTTSETEKLGGAEFKLYQKGENGNEIAYTNTVMTDRVALGDDGSTMTTKVVSSKQEGNKGQLIIRGLAKGTYYLKEIKAPTGYSLSDHEYVIVVDATIDDEGNLTAWKVTVDGQELFAVSQGTVTTQKNEENGHIPNTKLSSLPSTGGIGTTIFTIGGCTIMIIAAGLYFASRRKSSK